MPYLYRSFFTKTSFFCLLLPAVALRSTRATGKGRGERGKERGERRGFMQGAEKVRRSWEEKSVGRLTYFSPQTKKGEEEGRNCKGRGAAGNIAVISCRPSLPRDRRRRRKFAYYLRVDLKKYHAQKAKKVGNKLLLNFVRKRGHTVHHILQ